MSLNIYTDITQQSDQWFKVRAGRPTASNFSRIFTTKLERSTQWSDFCLELVASSIRPDEIKFAGNRHTDRGNALEPEARQMFMDLTGFNVKEVGFVTREDDIVGCSPDGIIVRECESILCPADWEAGFEIKCPESSKHISYLLDGGLPSAYFQQVHGSMSVTGLDAWWFMSYCPGIKPHIIKVERDERTENIKEILDDFVVFYAKQRQIILERLMEPMRNLKSKGKTLGPNSLF